QQPAEISFSFMWLIWALVFLLVLVILGVFLKRFLTKKKQADIFLKNRSISRIVENLSGLDFEIWVQQLFLSLGAKARVTPSQGDHGIDVIVEFANQKIAVQCKKYYGNKFVGEPMLRDLYGVKAAGGFDRVILITTGNFTREALEWAKDKKGLILINAKLLEGIIMDRNLLKKLIS
ncbi:MAG: restriction endonuclease, partial [Candidatus Doudnabacteria bacterium]|nr:restriction endonuclease [Candidatus Doudnabacteria bacterium]